MKTQTPLAIFVGNLSNDERHEIIRTYKLFEEEGCIGDEAIRIYTTKFLEELNIPNDMITFWMVTLANECFRYYYDEQFCEK